MYSISISTLNWGSLAMEARIRAMSEGVVGESRGDEGMNGGHTMGAGDV